MPKRYTEPVLRDLTALWKGGSLVGSTDAELIARYNEGGPMSAESAFSADGAARASRAWHLSTLPDRFRTTWRMRSRPRSWCSYGKRGTSELLTRWGRGSTAFLAASRLERE